MPVYVMFTKADLIAGFVEFFNQLGREERDQVWGMTFPLDAGTDDNGAVAGFGAGFDELLTRLNEQMLEWVNKETDLQRRRLIYGFPQQLASLRETVDAWAGAGRMPDNAARATTSAVNASSRRPAERWVERCMALILEHSSKVVLTSEMRNVLTWSRS